MLKFGHGKPNSCWPILKSRARKCELTVNFDLAALNGAIFLSHRITVAVSLTNVSQHIRTQIMHLHSGDNFVSCVYILDHNVWSRKKEGPNCELGKCTDL